MDHAQIVQSVLTSLTAESDDLCAIVRWTDVDAAERAAADATLEVVKEELHLPKSLRIGWFRSHQGPPQSLLTATTFGHVPATIAGCYRPWSDPETVWIRSGIGPQRAATAVIHEARHAWQLHFRSTLFEDPLWREIDACRYCSTFIDRFSQH